MFTFVNNTNHSHKSILKELFSEADTINIAVAFLRPSGLRNLKQHLTDFSNDKSKKITFYIGTGFGETDPQSLLDLFKILKKNTQNKLVLCSPNAGIFHSKIYVFEKKSMVKVVIGSSNLTEAGWVTNDEASLLIETSTNSPEFLSIRLYIENLYKKYYAADVLNLIHQYKYQLDKHGKDNRPPFHFRRNLTEGSIDFDRLRELYKSYLKSEDFVDVLERESKYIQAKENLLQIANSKNLTKKQFHDLFGPLVGHKGYHKLWHSGSIQRATYKTLNYRSGFKKIVKFAELNNHLSVNVAYSGMLQLRKSLKAKGEISGVGENIIAEILMSFNPHKFANLNINPVTVLDFMGRSFPPVRSFKGSTYQEYINLLTNIKVDLKMNSFLEIDSFFNYVYWLILEK